MTRIPIIHMQFQDPGMTKEATSYCKTDTSFTAFIAIAAILIRLR